MGGGGGGISQWRFTWTFIHHEQSPGLNLSLGTVEFKLRRRNAEGASK